MMLEAARCPTFYFIGVSTQHSSIMQVFPRWAEHLGLRGVVIRGIDLPLHASRELYRDVVRFLKQDPLSLGALVTTHKLDLYEACTDLFDEVDEHAQRLLETSCISKAAGRLICHAKDPITSGLALDSFVPEGHFQRTAAPALLMGAGGSAIALSWHLMQSSRGSDRPHRLIVTDPSVLRLREIERLHQSWQSGIACDYCLVDGHLSNDAVLADLAAGALVVNATGMGKDRPGSPLSDGARFPDQALVWELNYRGELQFLQQARRQAERQRLHVEDGWVYFIHGWTRVIAEVFHIEVPASGPGFQQLCRIAQEATKPTTPTP